MTSTSSLASTVKRKSVDAGIRRSARLVIIEPSPAAYGALERARGDGFAATKAT